MCGIAGIVSQKTSPRKEHLLKMAATLKHRGPDQFGTYTDESAALACRRLRIIDLKSGKQPISNEDGSAVIVLNGEIYNYQSLRKMLLKKGHKFKTKSDTEVILHLWEDYGPDCLKYLNGMFAIAIWDRKRKTLFLARDRLGQKPLLYARIGNTLIFASEIKALLKYPGVSPLLDYEGLDLFLTLQYIPAPKSIFKNIRKLPPGHYLLADARHVRVRRYWQLDFNCKTSLSYEEAKEKLITLLRESVRLRLVSEVSLGVFLSGGIDSSIIAALMAEIGSSVRSLSLGFGDLKDELPWAQRVSQAFHTNHKEISVGMDLIHQLSEAGKLFDEPLADSSILPNFYLSKLAKKDVTVILTGVGGDELFGGYHRYTYLRRRQKFRMIAALLGQTADYVKFIERLYWQESERKTLYNPSEAVPWKATQKMLKKAGNKLKRWKDGLDAAFSFSLEYYLPGDLLYLSDMTSMAHAVESRAPFLDHRLVEFAVSLPSDWKVTFFQKKRILKDACRNLLPPEIIHKEKQGFSLPFQVWLKDETLKEFVLETIRQSTNPLNTLFDKKYLDNLLESYRLGDPVNPHRIWMLLNLSLWLRHYKPQLS